MPYFQELRLNFRVKYAWPFWYLDEHSIGMLWKVTTRHQISSALGFEEAESCDCQQITRRHNIRICYVITRNCHGRKIKPKTKCCRWKWVWINRWKVTSLSDNVHSQVCRKTVELEQLSEIWNLISDPYPVVQLPLFCIGSFWC